LSDLVATGESPVIPYLPESGIGWILFGQGLSSFEVFLDALFRHAQGAPPGKVFRAIVIVQTGDVPFVRARQSLLLLHDFN